MHRIDVMKSAGRTLVSRRKIVQDGFAIATGCACLPWALSEARTEQPNPGATSEIQTWTIGNEQVRRVLTFQPGKGLFTSQLSNLATGADFINPDSIRMSLAHEFSFECNGRRCEGSNGSLELLGAHETSLPNIKSLTIRLRHRGLALELFAVYTIYNGHPAIRKHLILRNAGPSALHISHMDIESLAVSLGPANELTLLTQYGTIPRETFYTGRAEDACLMLVNGRTKNGIAVISEVPGWMKTTEIQAFYNPEHATIDVKYNTDLLPFERAIPAGEEFVTARASLVLFRNGDGFNDPHWVLPSFAAKVLERRVDTQGPPWIYNTWEPFQRLINHETAMALTDAAGAMGMDIFTIDDGWQQEYGENEVNFAAFPRGLQPIIEAVEAKGMRLGLWLPVAAIGTSTAVYREHPEWAALDEDGKLKITGTAAGEKALMCMASAYRETVAGRINHAIERFHLAYVKLDLTTIFNAYGEAPGCWAKNHYHGNWAESLNMIYEGISYVTRKVYEKHPNVLLDLTFELWGQKHIIDAGLLAAGDLDWMSNVDDNHSDSAGPLQARQLLYQRAASMPAEAMLIGNMIAGLPTNEESFATVIGSAPLFLGDLRKLSVADRQWFYEKISWFKQLRKSTKISDSFFPLGSWQQPTPIAWDGFARFDHSGNGVIALFRNESNATEAVVQLPRLPAGKYKLHSIFTGGSLGVFSHSDWSLGIPIGFPGQIRAEVVEVASVRN